MASTRSPITPKDTFKPKIRRIPLTPKNIPANNMSSFDGSRETDCKWIAIAVAGTADKENRHVGGIAASAGKDLRSIKREDASPIRIADHRWSDDKWITIPLTEDKGSRKSVSNVDSGKVEVLPKNNMDASLAEELEIIRQKNERLRVDRAKMEDIFKARDQVMKRMEEQLELGWKAQEKLEMELEKLLSLKELETCLSGFQPVVSLREKHRSKPKTGDRMQPEKVQQVDQVSPAPAISAQLKRTASSTATGLTPPVQPLRKRKHSLLQKSKFSPRHRSLQENMSF